VDWIELCVGGGDEGQNLGATFAQPLPGGGLPLFKRHGVRDTNHFEMDGSGDDVERSMLVRISKPGEYRDDFVRWHLRPPVVRLPPLHECPHRVGNTLESALLPLPIIGIRFDIAIASSSLRWRGQSRR
jgi:hypothetical protein